MQGNALKEWVSSQFGGFTWLTFQSETQLLRNLRTSHVAEGSHSAGNAQCFSAVCGKSHSHLWLGKLIKYGCGFYLGYLKHLNYWEKSQKLRCVWLFCQWFTTVCQYLSRFQSDDTRVLKQRYVWSQGLTRIGADCHNHIVGSCFATMDAVFTCCLGLPCTEAARTAGQSMFKPLRLAKRSYVF